MRFRFLHCSCASVKILVLSNLFPPHHAGTFDFRCQQVVEALRQRGHVVRVLTSNHGLNTEQRDEEIERRLWLNGVFDHPLVTGFNELKALEIHNNAALRESISTFDPNLIYVWSLIGLSKSLVFTIRISRLPVAHDVADDWIAREVRLDPWLRWWNQEKLPMASRLARASLEASGQRNRIDELAPTRMMKGLERLPDVYGTPEEIAKVEPNSIAGFRFERIYFCSQALKFATEQAGFRVSHAEVIYPGIPTEVFVGELKPISAPVRKFLVVARLTEGSGVMTAVDALRQARANGLKATLNIYGKGESEYIAQLRSFVVLNQLPVEFLTVGNTNRELAAVYRQHDALLYTSEKEEPFPITPLEAMASGLPVIGSSLGGAREFFRHGENALTFTPGDAAELASRMQELQMQPALRCQMAENAQNEVISNFNQSTVIDQIENFLNASLEIWQQT
jgi:glycogen synthase